MGKSSLENHGSSGNPQSPSWSKKPENARFSGLFRVEALKGGFSELFTPLTKKVTFNYVVFILLLYGDLLFWEKKF